MYIMGHVACTGEMRYGYKILSGKPKGKIIDTRKAKAQCDNIKTDLKEIGCKGVD
jgi:hypothetical protein